VIFRFAALRDLFGKDPPAHLPETFTDAKLLGERLKAERRKYRKTRAALASECELAERTIYEVENGCGQVGSIRKICSALSLKLELPTDDTTDNTHTRTVPKFILVRRQR
jgi:DNA-binding XRE family transcriptional regulator